MTSAALEKKHYDYKVPCPNGEQDPVIGSNITIGGEPGHILEIKHRHHFLVQMTATASKHWLFRLQFVCIGN